MGMVLSFEAEYKTLGVLKTPPLSDPNIEIAAPIERIINPIGPIMCFATCDNGDCSNSGKESPNIPCKIV